MLNTVPFHYTTGSNDTSQARNISLSQYQNYKVAKDEMLKTWEAQQFVFLNNSHHSSSENYNSSKRRKGEPSYTTKRGGGGGDTKKLIWTDK